MTSDEVLALVDGEIGDRWLQTNLHGCDLRRCLVTPILRVYEDTKQPPESVTLWLVLEEVPETSDGYKIVYDEQQGLFGLACPGVSGSEVFLGYYGTFWETFEAM